MATAKSIREVVGTVYRDGKAVQKLVDLHADSGSIPCDLKPSSVWSWLPARRMHLLLDECFERVKRAHTPPRGEPFIEDGRPYSDAGQFAEDLAHEFQERLYQMISARGEGPYFVLPEDHPQ